MVNIPLIVVARIGTHNLKYAVGILTMLHVINIHINCKLQEQYKTRKCSVENKSQLEYMLREIINFMIIFICF